MLVFAFEFIPTRKGFNVPVGLPGTMPDDPPGKGVAEGSYVVLYLYKVPKDNQEAMAKLVDQLSRSFVRHGTLRSDFFQLSTTETFGGFASITKPLASADNEEVWMELDYYRDQSGSAGSSKTGVGTHFLVPCSDSWAASSPEAMAAITRVDSVRCGDHHERSRPPDYDRLWPSLHS